MLALTWLLIGTGVYPLWRAWSSNQHSSLAHAVIWGVAAWLGWAGVLTAWTLEELQSPARYLALSLTACAGIAVLGARRPGVGAWNFVVAGLLAVFLLGLAETGLVGRLQPGWLIFLAAVLAVGILNYLPTRMGVAALLLSGGVYLEMRELDRFADNLLPELLVAAVPWVALGASLLAHRASEFDRVWVDFKDRFGAIWALRLQEQFNRSAANAGWPVYLGWEGLKGKDDVLLVEREEYLTALLALLKRFNEK